MRALITGSSGFVGSHLVEHLQASGDETLGLSSDAWDLGVDLGPETRGRIEAFTPDVIYHLAALSIPRDCGDTEPTAKALAVNVDGTRRVLELAASLTTRPRVMFTSSSRVYAPVDAANPIVTELYPLAPRTAYGKTKQAAEELCRAAVRRDGLDVVIVRSFTQSGPRMDFRLMLAEWAAQLVRGGDGSIDVASLDVTIDFLDVRDAVRALRMLAHCGERGETYNIGSGIAQTTGDVFRRLCEQAGATREARQMNPGRRSDPIADIAKLVAATDWRPQIDAARTCADVLADLRVRIGR